MSVSLLPAGPGWADAAQLFVVALQQWLDDVHTHTEHLLHSIQVIEPQAAQNKPVWRKLTCVAHTWAWYDGKAYVYNMNIIIIIIIIIIIVLIIIIIEKPTASGAAGKGITLQPNRLQSAENIDLFNAFMWTLLQIIYLACAYIYAKTAHFGSLLVV